MDYAKKYPVKSLSGVSDGILKSNVTNIVNANLHVYITVNLLANNS